MNLNLFISSDLNYTPCGASARCALGASHFARHSTSRYGAALLASLESDLSDSASLRYLRRRTLRVLQRRSWKISPSPQKTEKDSGNS